LPKGVVTEKNMIVLKNSRRYGYRLVNQENKIARKSFDPHNSGLLEHFQKSHSVIVTSFSPEMAVVIFENFARSLSKSGHQKICMCYTLNSEIASELNDNRQLQEELSKHINVMCMSEEELKILGGKESLMYATIPIILVTKGDKGSVIVDNTRGKNEHIVAKAFHVKKSMNDNGAGEAAHAAFIHTLISFKQSPLWKTQSLRRMLEISGYVANVAGALKIQAKRSLDFRCNLDYEIALSQCVNTSMKPHVIGKHILNKYVKDNESHNYHFELTTHQ
jgi:sugar/nucleoside kinase (ribokinase family)